MKTRKTTLTKIALLLLVALAISTLFTAVTYKPREVKYTPDCTTVELNPAQGAAVRCEEALKFTKEVRGWPFSFDANPPIEIENDTYFNDVRQSDYQSEKQTKTIANFAVYFLSLLAACGLYILARRFKHAHTRN